MKKRLNLFALFLGLMALTCAAALAEDEPAYGFKNLSVETAYSQTVTLTPVTENGATVTESEGAYPGTVKMRILYSAAQKGQEYALFVLTDDKAPTVDNIAYIDQQTAKDDNTVTFDAYPKKLSASSSGADYHVYISSNTDASSGTGITSYTKIAKLSYYAAATVTPGDVDEDGDVTAIDARITLQMSSGIIEEKNQTDKQKAAADVDKDGDVTAIDARMILQFSSGILATFD